VGGGGQYHCTYVDHGGRKAERGGEEGYPIGRKGGGGADSTDYLHTYTIYTNTSLTIRSLTYFIRAWD
jgi:hypothetical protein